VIDIAVYKTCTPIRALANARKELQATAEVPTEAVWSEFPGAKGRRRQNGLVIYSSDYETQMPKQETAGSCVSAIGATERKNRRAMRAEG
jgi:hypothetical protein